MDIPVLMNKSVNFLGELCKVVQFMKLYPETHPYIQSGFDKSFKALQELENLQQRVSIGIREDGLLCEDRNILDIPKQVEDFLVKLRKKNIHSLIVNRGVSMDELRHLVKLMAARDEDVVLDGRVKPQWLQSFKKLEINEIEYKIVGEDQIFGQGVQQEFIDYLKGSGGAGGAGGGFDNANFDLYSMIRANPERVAGHLMDALGQMMEQDEFTTLSEEEKAKAIRAQTEEMLKKMTTNIANNDDVDVNILRSNLMSLFNALPEDKKVSLFGEVGPDGQVKVEELLTKQSIATKAKLFFNEMKAHGDENQKDHGEVAKNMKQIMANDGEIVEIAEFIKEQVQNVSEEERRSKLSTLFGFLQSNIEFDPQSEAKVYLIEPEGDIREAYQMVLMGTNSHVSIFKDGEEALAAIKKEKPDMIIMDTKLPKLHGLELISRLKKMPDPEKIPLIINSRNENVKNEFEIMTYPEKMFFKKPMTRDELRGSVKAYSPEPKEVEKPDSQIEEDFKKANEIQHKLLPQSTPEVPGFDISCFYIPCRDVGGDYYDFFQIDQDHLGMICADVSGKGISGAMVMVMVRSLMKMIYKNSRSTKETLIRLNEMIVPDIRQGMFVSAMYVILNIPNKTLTVSNAGHNALLIARNDIPHQFMQLPGMVMGLRSGTMFANLMTEETIYLDYGDKFILFTDGVTEAFNLNKEEYGEPRLGQIVDNYGRFAHPNELVQYIYQDIEQFEAGAGRFDDITLMCVKCKDFEI
jgi:serine phosphatase RsbU (regulator of sigma subunit)